MLPGARRREWLENSSLYLIVDASNAEAVLAPALAGGVGIVQLRDKHASDRELLGVAPKFRALCDQHGALFILNDRPALAMAARADGVHVGQDDDDLAAVRDTVGPELLIGVSTHTPAQVDAALESSADYLGVGPVFATPTKPGRPAVGEELVRYAAAHADRPFFAIGGIDVQRAPSVVAAGATRLAVVRAIGDAADPGAAARSLRVLLSQEGRVGAAQ